MPTTNLLTQQEKQAYTILSELFLDTEHTQLELNHLTSSLRPLGIPVLTLEHVLRYDLFPILSPNLLSIAGEWQGFDEDWLLQQVHLSSNISLRTGPAIGSTSSARPSFCPPTGYTTLA
jgi:hypothetical protein